MGKTPISSKICVVCQRPFSWRKKWARVWTEVRYCSNACRRTRSNRSIQTGQPSSGPAHPED
ncbi:MAG: DUF2256 domain-containing protein [Saprospiraceae bacterium]